MKITVKKAEKLILKKAEEIRHTVDRSGFCKPDCEGCLRAAAKGLVDKDLRIKISGRDLAQDLIFGPIDRSVTDKALRNLAV